MKQWTECGGCAFADFRDAPNPGDHGKCRVGRPRLIAPLSRTVVNALTRRPEVEHGTFAGWPPILRSDGCAEGSPESKQ